MNKNILVICDWEESYCSHLGSYLKRALSIPFEIFGFTSKEALLSFKEKEEAILVISESVFSRNIVKGYKNILLLEERQGIICEDEVPYGEDSEVTIRRCGKYQSSEKLAENVLSMCLEMPEIVSYGIRNRSGSRMKLIGFFTPDKNVEQTAVSLNFADEMAKKHKLLFINNDSFCTENSIKGDEFESNLPDLMYYAECEPDRFQIYLEKAVKKRSEVDYIPAAGGQMRDATSDDYARFFNKVEETGKYEVLISDFSESFKGLTEIIKQLDAVIVLSGNQKNDSERMKLFRKELEETDGIIMNRIVFTSSMQGKKIMELYLSAMEDSEKFEQG